MLNEVVFPTVKYRHNYYYKMQNEISQFQNKYFKMETMNSKNKSVKPKLIDKRLSNDSQLFKFSLNDQIKHSCITSYLGRLFW